MFNTSGLYYEPNMILDYDSRIVNKLETSLIDDARVIIYDHHMFTVEATGDSTCAS
jgi:nanoRNase/pAp phosphatase (c-di-AMP/oligoRNAs hydrolase)